MAYLSLWNAGVSRAVLWSINNVLAAPLAGHDTWHAAVQRDFGIGAAETGESVTLGRSGKRKRWDSQRSFTPDDITLGALRRGVKRYNVRVWIVA